MSDLFRKEALDALIKPSLPSPISVLPTSWALVTGMLGSFAVGAIVFLTVQTFPRKETAIGITRYSQGEMRIVPSRSGILNSVYVTDGQVVKKNSVLALITTEQRLREGSVYADVMLGHLEQERTAANDHLKGLNESEPIQALALTQRITNITQQLDELRTGLDLKRRRLELATRAVDNMKYLSEKNIVTQQVFRDSVNNQLTMEGMISDTNTQIRSLEGQRTDYQLKLTQLPVDVAQQRAMLIGKLGELEEKKANIIAGNEFSLIAPFDGMITSLQGQPGEPVDNIKPLMTLIPTGSELQVELYVPSKAIGFIERGQTVRLMMDPFRYTKFGVIKGVIEEISSTVFKPSEVSAAVRLIEPSYRITVKLNQKSITAYGIQRLVGSGWALTADIILDNRSFMNLAMDPLLASYNRVLGDR